MKKRKKKQNDNELQLTYSGNVTVQVVRNDKVVKTIGGHNSGTYRLFRFIADCLISNYSGANAPKYIQVFHTNSASDTDVSFKDSLVGLIAVATETATHDVLNDTAVAKLTFTIPGELFATGTTQQTPNLFCLYSQLESANKTNMLASYYMDGGIDSGTISKDVNIIVIWELGISNK